MHDLYIAYDKFSCQYILTTFFVIFSFAFLSPGCHHIVGFSARILLLTPSFLSAPHQSASGLGFLACFSLPAPTTWVFPLASYSSRPAFSPLPAYQLPGWVFSLVFLFLHPRRGFFRSYPTPHAQFSLRSPSISFRAGFSRLLFSTYTHAVGFSARILLLTPSFLSATYPLASWVGFLAYFPLPRVSPHRGFFRSLTTPHAQFFPRYLPISFRAGFSRLLFSSCAHAVGFSAHLLLLTPSFLSATYPLASWVGFLACFSLPAPTPWVFPLAFYSSRPAFSPLPANQLSGHVFTLANTRACKNAMRLGNPKRMAFHKL